MKKSFFKMTFFLILMLIGLVSFDSSSANRPEDFTTEFETIDSIYSEELEIIRKKEIRQELIIEVEEFIEASHNKDLSSETRNEIAVHIVEQALEKNVDICFVVAQGKLETNLGEYGIGKTRKSIFGIYKYFDSYEDGIKFYINTLTKNYLTNGRTEHDLMQNYVHKGGYRYAENEKYEIELRGVYSYVRNNTSIYKLQKSLTND